MKLEEVEAKLYEIFNLATNTQSLVRVLLYGGPEPIKLTDTQKKTVKKAAKEGIDKIAVVVKEIQDKWK